MIDRRSVIGLAAAFLVLQSHEASACSPIRPSPEELKLPAEFADAIKMNDLKRARTLLAEDFFFHDGTGSFGGHGPDEFLSQLRRSQEKTGKLTSLETRPVAQMFFRTALHESARYAVELPKNGILTSCDSSVRLEERIALYQTNNAMKIDRLSYLPLWSY